jgi:hypothetical protein
MKVYENIEKAKNFKLELKKVIDDLIPLRGDNKATEAYYDKHLENDWAYSRVARRQAGLGAARILQEISRLQTCRKVRLHLTKQEHSERHF